MILTLPDHDERRRIINKMHRTKDKDLCRRLNAILLLADGHSVSAVSRLTAAARSSINRWVNWYTLFGLEGLESEPRGRKPVLLAGLSRARTLLATGLYGEVLALTEPLLQAARAGGEDRVVAEILLVQGLALYPRGELTLAEATLHEAVLAAARGLQPPPAALVIDSIQTVYSNQMSSAPGSVEVWRVPLALYATGALRPTGRAVVTAAEEAHGEQDDPGDGGEQVVGLADAEQVPGFGVRQLVDAPADDGRQVLLLQRTADAVPVESAALRVDDGLQSSGGLPA